ncbi:hypothetical protein ACFQHO_30470 [Actinomadura yumaensis]
MEDLVVDPELVRLVERRIGSAVDHGLYRAFERASFAGLLVREKRG